MKNKYLIRLDDACPTMDKEKWLRMEALLEKYNIKPMVGVIPNNRDPKQIVGPVITDYWEKVREWQNKGWSIALHGYDHCYISDKGLQGLNPLWKRSEFSGVPLEIQKQKIQEGYSILKKEGLVVNYFFAPAHTFDENTLKALLSETDIRIISDTIALRPYKKGEFIFIPQYTGSLYEKNVRGIFTRCFHPTTMKEEDFKKAELFIKEKKDCIVSFTDLDFSHIKSITLLDKLIAYNVFRKRKAED